MSSYQVIPFKQTNYKLFVTILPFRIIDEYSKVLIYGKEKGGYQRELDKKHYTKIKQYVLSNDFIFPTSIVLGLDEEKERMLFKKGDNSYIDFSNCNDKILRVVDGQHRLQGIKDASIYNPGLLDLELSVIVMLTPSNQRSLEMNIFSTINSKAKRIKVDLIALAEYDYRILENQFNQSDLKKHIGIEVAYFLNGNHFPVENLYPEIISVWLNAIKFGIHDEEKIGIIGVSAFCESIDAIISTYLNTRDDIGKLKEQDLIDFSRKSAYTIAEFIKKAWDIVQIKWPESFKLNEQHIDSYNEINHIWYSTDSYIQRTLGTKAINYLLSDIVRKHGLNNNSLSIFLSILKKSELLVSDWLVGWTFSGYSSESAFHKISRIVEGKEPIPNRK